MEALLKVYPDARFVMTHRRPEKVLPSICLLINLLRACFLKNPSPLEMAVRQVDQWEQALHRIMQFRAQLGEQHFFDIYHSEQIVNPEKGLKNLYEWLGWEFSDQFVTALTHWQKNNPKGNHKPDAAKFGLDLDAVKKRFEFYTDSFGCRM